MTRKSTSLKQRVLISAIKKREVLRFIYGGKIRIVEPQTYGISTTGHEVLRAFQTGGRSHSGQMKMAKLFDVSKILELEKTGQHFLEALPSHNPQDSAMIKIIVSLPKAKRS